MMQAFPTLARARWLAALLLCATLAACGGDSNDNKPDGNTGTPVQPGAKPDEPGKKPETTPQLRCAP